MKPVFFRSTPRRASELKPLKSIAVTATLGLVLALQRGMNAQGTAFTARTEAVETGKLLSQTVVSEFSVRLSSSMGIGS